MMPTCPYCRREMRPVYDVTFGRDTFVCLACQHTIDPQAAAPAPVSTLPGETRLEKTLVAYLTHELEKRGYTVLHIGQRRARGSGTTEGTGDMLVGHAERGNDWKLLETKVGRNKPSPAQQALINAGLMAEVRTLEDALVVLEEVSFWNE